VIAMPFTVQAQAVPFGGPITIFSPVCQNYAPGAVMGIGLQIGTPSFTPAIYVTGVSRSYASGPPSHPGQFLLGMLGGAMPCLIWVPCGPTVCPAPNPTLPGGLMILYHGSSI